MSNRLLNWAIIVSNAFIITIIWLSFFSLWFAGKTKWVLQTSTHSLVFLSSNRRNIAMLSALRKYAWSTLFFFLSSFTFSLRVSDQSTLNLFFFRLIVRLKERGKGTSWDPRETHIHPLCGLFSESIGSRNWDGSIPGSVFGISMEIRWEKHKQLPHRLPANRWCLVSSCWSH